MWALTLPVLKFHLWTHSSTTSFVSHIKRVKSPGKFCPNNDFDQIMMAKTDEADKDIKELEK